MVVLRADPESTEIRDAVETTTLCRTLNVLPRAGGLYDQPWIVVEMMKMVIAAQHKKDEEDRKKANRGSR